MGFHDMPFICASYCLLLALPGEIIIVLDIVVLFKLSDASIILGGLDHLKGNDEVMNQFETC